MRTTKKGVKILILINILFFCFAFLIAGTALKSIQDVINLEEVKRIETSENISKEYIENIIPEYARHKFIILNSDEYGNIAYYISGASFIIFLLLLFFFLIKKSHQ